MAKPRMGPSPRTARTNVLLMPEVRDGLQKIAVVKRTTVNSILNEVAGEYVAAHQHEIERYDRFFEEE